MGLVMIKLKELLIESGVLVKNKKTGNVYRVKKSNPEKHDDVGKKERSDKRKHDYSNAPHESEPGFGDSKSGYDVNTWNEHYVKRDENGSVTIGTPHSENDEQAQEFVENNVIPEVDKVMDEAEAQGKEVVFLGEDVGAAGGVFKTTIGLMLTCREVCVNVFQRRKQKTRICTFRDRMISSKFYFQ